tara:strand:- start:247 stop:675 length:429 start_codon:yes stop_codon:yes gene_type:complete
MKKSDDTIIKSIEMPRNISKVVHYRAKCDKRFVFIRFVMFLVMLVELCKGEDATNNIIPSLSDERNDDDNIPIRQIKFGETVKLEELGPVIVQSDCTLRRIDNWHKLTEGEREATMRRIGGRNKVRLNKCREQQVDVADGEL